jgi:hypothetical protein
VSTRLQLGEVNALFASEVYRVEDEFDLLILVPRQTGHLGVFKRQVEVDDVEGISDRASPAVSVLAPDLGFFVLFMQILLRKALVRNHLDRRFAQVCGGFARVRVDFFLVAFDESIEELDDRISVQLAILESAGATLSFFIIDIKSWISCSLISSSLFMLFKTVSHLRLHETSWCGRIACSLKSSLS